MATLYTGVHASLTAGQTLRSLLEDEELHCCRVLQIFLGSPRSLAGARALGTEDVERSRAHLIERDRRLFVHHPYVSNFAGSLAQTAGSLARLRQEVDVLAAVVGTPERGAVVLHPGSACRVVDATDARARAVAKSKRRLASAGERREALDSVIASLSTLGAERLRYVAVENAAGERNKLCSSLEEMRHVAERLPTVRICVDTAHAFGAGLCRFDSADATRALLRQLDGAIGLDRLACVHLNDSEVRFGGHADRHARLCFGEIWAGDDLSGLRALLVHARERGTALIGESSIAVPEDVVALSLLAVSDDEGEDVTAADVA
jgi:endonuclease IV